MMHDVERAQTMEYKCCIFSKLFAILFVTGMLLTASMHIEAADIDVYSEINGPDSMLPGTTASIQVDYGNNGPETSYDSSLKILFPFGVPAPPSEITQTQMDSLLNSFSDTSGNVATIGIDETCSGLTVEVLGHPNGWGSTGLQDLTAGASETIGFDLAVSARPSAGVVRIVAPPELARDYRYGTGVCDENCENCLGPRLESFQAELQEWELVNDHQGNIRDGCSSFVGFHSGNVAVVEDSGACDLGIAAAHARYSSALALVVLSLDQAHPDAVYNNDGWYWNNANPPLVVLSYNDGQAIETYLEGGKAVHGLIGRGTPSRLWIGSSIVSSNTGENDIAPENNESFGFIDLELFVFGDGFESGGFEGWSIAIGGLE